MAFISNKVTGYACVLAILLAISACASLVLGFMNLGTFHSSEVKSHVGIWLGLIMFINIFTLLLVMGTRRFMVLSSSFIISIFCLGVCIVAIVFAIDYRNEFERFGNLNRQQVTGSYCEKPTTDDQCICYENQVPQQFKDGFKFQACPLIHTGEDMWLAMIVLAAINAFFSLGGLLLFIVGACQKKREV
eukprot:TCONS_00069354-protein